MKNEFINLLKSINRNNTSQLIDNLSRLNFFIAPASSNKHLAEEGGLVKHSLNVMNIAHEVKAMMSQFDERYNSVNDESITIVSLLHDICKANIYNPTVKRKRLTTGEWVDAAGYEIDFSELPYGHGEKSVIIALQSGYPLNEDEIAAIRWHMYAFGVNMNSYEEMGNFNAANKIPLVRILQVADQLSTAIGK